VSIFMSRALGWSLSLLVLILSDGAAGHYQKSGVVRIEIGASTQFHSGCFG